MNNNLLVLTLSLVLSLCGALILIFAFNPPSMLSIDTSWQAQSQIIGGPELQCSDNLQRKYILSDDSNNL